MRTTRGPWTWRAQGTTIPSEKMSWMTSTLALARGVSTWGAPGDVLGWLWGWGVPGKVLGWLWGWRAPEKGLWLTVGLEGWRGDMRGGIALCPSLEFSSETKAMGAVPKVGLQGLHVPVQPLALLGRTDPSPDPREGFGHHGNSSCFPPNLGPSCSQILGVMPRKHINSSSTLPSCPPSQISSRSRGWTRL